MADTQGQSSVPNGQWHKCHLFSEFFILFMFFPHLCFTLRITTYSVLSSNQVCVCVANPLGGADDPEPEKGRASEGDSTSNTEDQIQPDSGNCRSTGLFR